MHGSFLLPPRSALGRRQDDILRLSFSVPSKTFVAGLMSFTGGAQLTSRHSNPSVGLIDVNCSPNPERSEGPNFVMAGREGFYLHHYVHITMNITLCGY
jgi:hypothetical protein